jgi:precorrin-4 methylase
MDDWHGRRDVNENLMALQTSMVVYTMHLDYPKFFEKLGRYYSPDTPVAVVCDAGSSDSQVVIRSTVKRFLRDVDYKDLPDERHILLIGHFLKAGQSRKDGLKHGSEFIQKMHEQQTVSKE